MFENQVQEPKAFIEVLRQFHATPAHQRGELANAMSDAIIHKRVDLAEVRQLLIDSGDHGLMETLDQLLDLIETYIEEGGVDE